MANSSFSTTTITTPVTVANGGTGASTFTDAGVLIGNGTGAVQVTSTGTAGQVLTSNGASADPTFQTVSATGIGAWELVTANTFSVTSTGLTWVDLFSITSLSGDADIAYRLVLLTDDASEYGSGTGFTTEYGLKLNNSTSNTYYWTNWSCISATFAIDSASRTDNGRFSTNRVGNSSARNYFAAELFIKASKETLEGYTTRGWHGTSSGGQNGGQPQLSNFAGCWGDVTNNLTDIRVQAYNIDNTSPTIKGQYVLYKIKKT